MYDYRDVDPTEMMKSVDSESSQDLQKHFRRTVKPTGVHGSCAWVPNNSGFPSDNCFHLVSSLKRLTWVLDSSFHTVILSFM